MTLYSSIFVFIFCIFFAQQHFSAQAHQCIYDDLAATAPKASIVRQNYSTNQRARAAQNIRIHVDTEFITDDHYTCFSVGQQVQVGTPITSTACTTTSSFNNCWYTCTASDVVSSTQSSYVTTQLIPAAIQRISSALSILDPVQGDLSLVGGYCGVANGIQVNSGYSVQNSDLVLFLTLRPTQQRVLAWAIECRVDQDNRPIAGQINIGPGSLSGIVANDVTVVIHEITHILGFSSAKIPAYFDSTTGLPYTNPTIDVQGPNGGLVTKLRTPNVLAIGRQHFGCSDLDGVQLEDGGAAGSQLSHWEKRVLGNEYMVATPEAESVFSAFTLALFADMGWYSVDYAQASPLIWGLNKGCNFVNGECTSWTGTGYECTSLYRPTCSFDRKAISYCLYANYTTPLPSQYQWFDGNPNAGGIDPFLDYCPTNLAYSDGDCRVPSNAPADAAWFGSTYNANSRCFETTLLATSRAPLTASVNACYEMRCNANNVLEIGVGNTFYPCDPNGGPITVPSYSGSLTCPPSAEMCFGTTTTPITPTTGPSVTASPSPLPTTRSASTTVVSTGIITIPVSSAKNLLPKLGLSIFCIIFVTLVNIL